MRTETKEYLRVFEKVTGTKPKSAKMYTGSMKHFMGFVLRLSKDVNYFYSGFYKSNPDGTYNRSFNGVNIAFIGSEFEGCISFDIAKSDLNKHI